MIKVKPAYIIKEIKHRYTYRSYMACEDHGPDDCVGYNYEYVIMRGRKQLKKTFTNIDDAQKYVKKLEKISHSMRYRCDCDTYDYCGVHGSKP